ncbi:MAG: hypothetical protein JNM66_21860, partial [Bryobacterales bacterium]|nr:hypothetical protein [Bryobacterales bacterium]
MATACEANVGSSTCTVTAGTTWTGLGYGQAYGYDSYSNRWVDPSGTVPILILQPTGSGAFSSATNRFSAGTFGGAYDGAGQMTAQSSVASSITRADEAWDAMGKR